MASKTPLAIARALNAHHNARCAGFYARTKMSGRFFRARVHAGQLQVSPDFGRSWTDVPPGTEFDDGNGSSGRFHIAVPSDFGAQLGAKLDAYFKP